MRHSRIGKSSALYSMSIIGFFATLHVALPTYFNSSFLSTFTDEKTVSLIYFIIAFVSIISLLAINDVLRKYGNYRTTIGLIILQIFIFGAIVASQSFYVITPLFIAGMAITGLLAFTLDIFLEKSTDAEHAGTIRGLYMTATNGAWVLAPLIGGALIMADIYSNIYIASLAFLFPLLYLVHKNFSTFKDPHYPTISVRATLQNILRNKDMVKIFGINIILQTFYAWMAVYMPLYLHSTIGFSWNEVSIILTIMLVPFVLVELPLGKLADRKWGEKEILAVGFIIMGVATCALPFFSDKNILIWSGLLFITRIGAAAAEVMIETYFFKKVNLKDSEILSMFRVTRPLSYFCAPIITVVGLVYTTNANLFVIVGILCMLGLFPIMRLRDTN